MAITVLDLQSSRTKTSAPVLLRTLTFASSFRVSTKLSDYRGKAPILEMSTSATSVRLSHKEWPIGFRALMEF